MNFLDITQQLVGSYSIDIDTIIVISFLLLNLILGIYSGRGITTIKEYAVGDRRFSTASLSATVIATCIGGGFFSGAITESYRQGLYFIIPAMGEPIALILVGYFLAPRMTEFLNTLSVAEAMGNLYGKYVRLITAFCGICLCVGILALQFKVCASILQVFLGVNSLYATLTSAVVIIAYAAIGGIKSVTVTDLLQFFTFAAVIPIISLIIWGTFDNPDKVLDLLATSAQFDVSQVFDISNHLFLDASLLLVFFLFPEFQPVFFQRIVMATTAAQARRAFIIAGCVVLIMLLVTVWVSVLMRADNPNLDPNNLLAYMIQKYSYTGFKGLAAIGVMSIVMSTADSYINSAAVLFSHDLYKVIKPTHVPFLNGTQLALPRIASVVFGIFAFVLAFKASSILELLLFVLGFYGPVVSVPLLMSLFGFRTTSKSVLIGMGAGFCTIILLKIINSPLEAFVPGVCVNLLFLLGSHYLMKQSGGWVGIKDDSALKTTRAERKTSICNFLTFFKNFRLFTFFNNNLPKKEAAYSVLGIFCIISVFSTIYSLESSIRHQHNGIIDFIYHSVIITSAIFISYPIWPPLLKNKNFIALFWNLVLPYSLIFVPTLLVIISNFGQLQLMIFMINLIMVAMLLRWQVALFFIFSGVISSLIYYSYYIGAAFSQFGDDMSLEFKVAYILLLFISVLIAFIKPHQEAKQLAEEKADQLWEKIIDMDVEVRKAENLKIEFLNNINHEVRTPITGITSLGQALWDSYDTLPEEKRKECVYAIAKSADRLISLMNNILDLSALTSLKIHLNIQNVKMSDLVKDRIKKCQNLYLESKALTFVTDIDDDLSVKCDEYHISHTIDNLIINAINYSRDNSLVEINLNKIGDIIEFSIKDEGIGIPTSELYDVFKPFTVSSTTRSTAGGRGVGLALCYAVISSHGGKIWAESDGKTWTKFRFNLK